MIYADDVDTITMGRTIECTASTGERPAARFHAIAQCGSTINARDERYNGMEYLVMIAGLLIGALLNYWTRKNGHPK